MSRDASAARAATDTLSLQATARLEPCQFKDCPVLLPTSEARRAHFFTHYPAETLVESWLPAAVERERQLEQQLHACEQRIVAAEKPFRAAEQEALTAYRAAVAKIRAERSAAVHAHTVEAARLRDVLDTEKEATLDEMHRLRLGRVARKRPAEAAALSPHAKKHKAAAVTSPSGGDNVFAY
jgi:hypothetical protein